MQIYKAKTIYEALNKTFKNLNKKFDKKINFLKATWKDIAPDWAIEASPYIIKNDVLIMYAKKNALILQYREKELLNIVQLVLPNEINSIKIMYK